MIASAAEWSVTVDTRPGSRAGNEYGRPLISAIIFGTLVLLPIQFVSLPFSLAPMDLWTVVTLPFACWYLIRLHHAVRLPYVAAFWLILVGSFIGTLSSVAPFDSLVAILKDTYLYIWFVLIAALLSTFDRRGQRPFMRLWLALVVVHGALVVAQFVSPDIYKTSLILASRYGALDQSRPSGLFNNANGTAIYQLLGFVPLVESRLPRFAASTIGLFIVASIMATGSLGAAAGFLAALAVIATILILRREVIGLARRVLVDLAILTILLTSAFYLVSIASQQSVAERFQYLFYGRFDKSAAGRLEIWGAGN